MLSRLAAIAVLALGLAGCGGDDDGDEPATPLSGENTTQREPPLPTATGEDAVPPKRPPTRSRTPASLAKCLREARGVNEAIVKGRDSEDAVFFSDIAGERVDVLGVTIAGEPAEVTVALFGSRSAAVKAGRQASGGGVDGRPVGAAVILAEPGAATDAVVRCLAETGYAEEGEG